MKSTQSPQAEPMSPKKTAAIGVREKLIVIFLIVKVLPLILLAYIAWQALLFLGTILRETAVVDTRNALTAMAVENIERLTTDTAQKVAEFLYQRDDDITFLVQACAFHLTAGIPPEQIERLFADFGETKTGLIRWHGNWTVGADGMSWIQTDPYILPIETAKRSVNSENENVHDGTSFRYRPPYGFGDGPNRFTYVPLYDEIALFDKNGQQIAKYVSALSTKKRFPFPEELLDISKPENTFVKAERYFEELSKLGKNGIYVSDVIGAYVPTRLIGMYTPDYMASRRIDAKIAELEAAADEKITDITWQLRVLNAELKNDEVKFNSHTEINKKVRDQIDRHLGHDAIWKIENKSLRQVSGELNELGFPELAEEILNIPFKPEEQAYAGAENPLGIRFEGIVRWVKPVLNDNNEIAGYVTFALNHDHLSAMIDHITPMPERYSELSNAFDGNYAFVWDYKCRSIVHPRHHSIYGYNPETGRPEIPWLEETLYNGMIAAGFDRADWQEYIAALENYVLWTGDKDSPAYQSRSKRPAPALTQQGLVGLDGRYLNNAPQCTGWMDLTRDGGSGSFYILWSGLYKLTTASAIPYYTGQYSPEVQGNRRGFGFVTIGAGIDDFSRPANDMDHRLADMVSENIQTTTSYLVWTTFILSVVVILIAIWMASYLSEKLQWLIDGITQFQRGHRHFRFVIRVRDEFGQLADSFNKMAENVVQSIHTPFVITDRDLSIVYANEPCLQVLGERNLENIIGKSYKEKSIYGYGSKYCPVTALHHGKEAAEVRYLARTDSYILGIANYLLDEHGQKLGYIITSNDVTELSRQQIELKRAKEEAELASQHKSRFLARMSHELRTPMNAIIGFNDITRSKISNIQSTGDLQDLNDYLERLKTASMDLLKLLNDILEASNLESGYVSLAEKSVDLRELLKEIAVKTKRDCTAKHLKWTAHFDELVPHRFITDGLRLQQVINNLLSNAVKYTPEHGSIEFIVRQKERRNGKSLLSFTVQDTGEGIPVDKREIIFHPFEQVETEKNKYTSGGGLGLVVVRKILELFDTDIAVQSEVGKGSTFSFEIWLREEEKSNDSKPETIKQSFTGQKALVVDDVRLNRMVLVNLLHEAGFATDEAEDGKECVEMFKKSQENAYSIVFMDIQMPVMDGWESAVAIRNLPRRDAKTVPIVTISANAFNEDITKSLASGMNGHYAKPIQKDVLSEILAVYCKPIS